MAGVFVHRRIEKATPAQVFSLGFQQGPIGLIDHVLRAQRRLHGRDGNTQSGSDAARQAADGKGSFQGGQDARGDPPQVIGVGVRQGNEECVGAETGKTVGFPQHRLDALGNRLQQHVRDRLAVLILNRPETVKAEAQDGHPAAVATLPGEARGQGADEKAPVGDAGQGVAEREATGLIVRAAAPPAIGFQLGISAAHDIEAGSSEQQQDRRHIFEDKGLVPQRQGGELVNQARLQAGGNADPAQHKDPKDVPANASETQSTFRKGHGLAPKSSAVKLVRPGVEGNFKRLGEGGGNCVEGKQMG